MLKLRASTSNGLPSNGRELQMAPMEKTPKTKPAKKTPPAKEPKDGGRALAKEAPAKKTMPAKKAPPAKKGE
jgi:hypothetical protein